MANKQFGSKEFLEKALETRKRNKLLKESLNNLDIKTPIEFYTTTHIRMINAWNDYCAEKIRIEKGVKTSFQVARKQLSLLCKLAIKRRAELLEISKAVRDGNLPISLESTKEESNSKNLKNLDSLNDKDDENFEGVEEVPSTSVKDKN